MEKYFRNFGRNNIFGNWVRRGRNIIDTVESIYSDTGEAIFEDIFIGLGLSINGDGRTIAIGAPLAKEITGYVENTETPILNPKPYVCVFEYIFKKGNHYGGDSVSTSTSDWVLKGNRIFDASSKTLEVMLNI